MARRSSIMAPAYQPLSSLSSFRSRFVSLSKWKQLTIFLLLSIALLACYGVWTDASTFQLQSPKHEIHEPDYWTWDTVTRFQKYTSKSLLTKEDLCHDFPTDILSRIQVVLKTGATESKERVDASMSSVAACITNLLIVSDQATDLHGHRVHDVLSDIAPLAERINSSDFKTYEAMQSGQATINGEQGWRLDRFKFLPMIEEAKSVNPTAEWFVFMETDTYVVWDNLFRLLDKFDPSQPLYFGSPSPGAALEGGGKVWFAYGGSGIVLSKAAVEKLTYRKTGSQGEYLEPSLSERYMERVDRDCCGDSVLGFALYESGVRLSGLYPMFNAHPLHGIPFDESNWCQPVITIHKSLFSDMTGLAKWESKREKKDPLLHGHLLEYLKLGELSDHENWDNGDWGGFVEPDDSPAHTSLDACRQACQNHNSCLSFTWDSDGHCIFVRTIRLGSAKKVSPNKLTAGWDNDGILNWEAAHQCKAALWMKPSITRIF